MQYDTHIHSPSFEGRTEERMNETNSYTAPAVINCTDAVQTTKRILTPPTDSKATGSQEAPGSVGFSL